MSDCPTCQTPSQPGARFCGGCGGALAEPVGATLQRILTFTFIDLVGSTALAARTDLESYDTLLQRYHGICADAVTAFQGQVLELQGDGALACFGLDTDSENAALAAVAAMLSIVEQVPRDLAPLEVRVGVHSGTVMSRAGGDATRPRMTGLNLNVAARVQALAPPGGVVITESTLDLLARIAEIGTEDLGPTVLKGLADPVRLFAVTGGSFRAAVPEAIRLVERDDILGALTAAPGDAGRAFALIGPPGIGKSAILAEAERRLGATTLIVALSARLNLRHSPLVPFAERLAAALGYESFPLAPDGDPADFADRLRRLDATASAQRIAILGDLLGLADRGGLYARHPTVQLRELRIAHLADLLAEVMRRQPTLLIFDDFHWADADSLDVVDRLLLRGLPRDATIILSSRPDTEIDALVASHGIVVLRPRPLSEAGARDVLAGLRVGAFAGAEVDRIVALAEGNPLFLRMLVSLLRRVGSQGGALPPSIEATFQGIINSFGEARDLLLLGAVIGRSFRREELNWLVSGRQREIAARLEDFARNGIVEREGGGWRFSHILLQDAAYNMIPASRRRGLHQQFATALASNDPARAAAFPEIVADHACAAEDLPLIARTAVAAGTAFLQRGVFDRAVHYLAAAHDALAALPAVDPRQRLRALTLLSSARVQRYGFSHPETIESYRLLKAATDPDGPASLESMVARHGLFAHRVIAGDIRGSRDIHAGMTHGARHGGRQHRLIERVNACAHALYRGRLHAAAAISAEVKRLYDRGEDGELFISLGADPLVSVMAAEANILGMFGHAGGVRDLTAAALAHVDAIGAAVHQPWVHIFNGAALYAAGAMQESQDRIAAGVEVADSQHAAFWSLTGRMWLGVHATDRGEADDGLAQLVASATAIGIGLNLPLMLGVIATRHLLAGDGANALRLARDATRGAVTSGQGLWLPEIWRRRAEIHRAAGDRAGADCCIRFALAHTRASGATGLSARIMAAHDGMAARPAAA